LPAPQTTAPGAGSATGRSHGGEEAAAAASRKGPNTALHKKPALDEDDIAELASRWLEHIAPGAGGPPPGRRATARNPQPRAPPTRRLRRAPRPDRRPTPTPTRRRPRRLPPKHPPKETRGRPAAVRPGCPPTSWPRSSPSWRARPTKASARTSGGTARGTTSS